MIDLSIIIPTCNRAELLKQSLLSIRDGVECNYEIIVVDGASEDNTPVVLEKAQPLFGSALKIIRETRREGFVKAANKGFRAATGRNMIWLNDDARALPGSLDEAVRQIDSAAHDVAFLAMFHRFSSQRNVAYEVMQNGKVYRLCHVRGTLYANFPIGRRATYERLGFLDERYFLNAADPDLSLKAWHAGLRIEPAYATFIDHDEHADDRRSEDSERGSEDNRKLFAKWDLPAKNLRWNDFEASRPCTLLGLKELPARSESKPRITFLISTYNRRPALLRTLRELQPLRKTADFSSEIIVVDNASTDGTVEAITEEFQAIRVVLMPANRGACAKNAGLEHATGNYIVFLDDDSHPSPGSIKRMIQYFNSNPRLGCAIFDVVLPSGSHECSAYPTVFVGCGAGFRREALLDSGGLPDDFFMQAEEYDLSLRLMNAGWQVRRFDDVRVEHLKTPSARVATRTTRLDTRNNLLVITRNFPSKWVMPFAVDWMRRYHWLAQIKGWRHHAAFWVGLAQGILKSMPPGNRHPVSNEVFEQFALIDQIRTRFERAARDQGIRRVLLLDVGKNILPFYLAAQACGIKVVAVSDSLLARGHRRYRGIPILDDASARELDFDAAVIANVAPVSAALRRDAWRRVDHRPVLDLLGSPQLQIMAA